MNRFFSYFIVASSTVVFYDWALTFGQEIELIWMHQWSLVTVLYLSVHYMGILYSVINLLSSLPSVSMTNAGCAILSLAQSWTTVVVNAVLNVIIITRLYAMYQRSRKMLIFLVVIFLAVTIASGVIIGIETSRVSWEELILFGNHLCAYLENSEGNPQLVMGESRIFGVAWQVLALCLAVWVAVKHFRELQRPSTGWTTGDSFVVLIKMHVLYFAVYVVSSCLALSSMSPKIMNSASMGVLFYDGILQILLPVQMFVLGPRLILSIREYHAKLVANSDAGTDISTIAFQQHVHMSAGSSV